MAHATRMRISQLILLFIGLKGIFSSLTWETSGCPIDCLPHPEVIFRIPPLHFPPVRQTSSAFRARRTGRFSHCWRSGNGLSRLRRNLLKTKLTTHLHSSGRANGPVLQFDVRLSQGATPFGSAFGCSTERRPRRLVVAEGEEAWIAKHSGAVAQPDLASELAESAFASDRRTGNRFPPPFRSRPLATEYFPH